MAPVVIRLERAFPHPRAAVYAWLTDFDSTDAKRAGVVLESRRILERSPDRVVYEGDQSMLGVRTRSVTEVSLTPPGAWRARVTEGPRAGSWTEYSLVERSNGCALTVTYNLSLRPAARMVLLRVLRPLVKRELAKMWDGFDASMRQDFAVAAPA